MIAGRLKKFNHIADNKPMWKLLLTLLLTGPVYAQVFTEDIAKINHAIAENEIENFLNNPTAEGLPGDYLQAISLPTYIDPTTICEEVAEETKPLNIRYELLAVTEEVPAKPDLQPQTTIIIAKFQEEESIVVKKLKDFLTTQATSGDKPSGKFELTQNRDAAKQIVVYSAPGTAINLNSQVKAAGTLAVDVTKLTSEPISTSNAQIQMDVVNKVSVNQDLGSSTEFKGSLESHHSTGTRALDSLSGTKFELSTVKALARVDSAITRNVHGYSQVNYTANTYDKEVRAIAGFDIKAANNAEILVFTGYSTRHSSLNRELASRDRELGFEYKKKNGVSIFGRVKDGEGKAGRSFETGIKIDLNR